MLISSIKHSLAALEDVITQLPAGEYTKPCTALSNATIGEHTRHVIEMFQCLENFYSNGVVNYDKRERNILIQTDPAFAIKNITAIKNNLEKDNKSLILHQMVDGEDLHIESNYHRELLYNLEHCIHHQALIKVAVLQCTEVVLDANFGVARSTIEYRSQCAQ